MIEQTTALFVDAYRHLNSKKLFWITLGLSALVVAAVAAVGITEKGISLLIWEIPVSAVNLNTIPSKAFFYKNLFIAVGFQFWLTWAAAILALVSTCNIMPDFVSGGTIELTLSKPISRVRLFLTKYLGGLIFVTLQVGVFTVASFLVIGLRGGEWVWSLFWAVPLVVLFFSYLYSVMAVLGILTRSAIASLLITILLWFVIFLVNMAEQGVMFQFREYNRQAMLILESKETTLAQELAAAETDDDAESPVGEDASDAESDGRPSEEIETELADVRERLEEARDDFRLWNRLHAWAFGVKTFLPKTGETMTLLSRYIISDQEMNEAYEDQPAESFQGQTIHGEWVSGAAVAQATEEETRSRSEGWVIGTSLLFEFAVLGLGAWLFSRRDF